MVDKTKIPICKILGVNIAAINMEWLVKYINNNIKNLSGDYICVSNVHTTVTSYDEPNYCLVQNEGLMSIPDGGPLSFIGRKRGFKEMKRTTGPDLMEEIFKISVTKGYRHFFFGSTEKTLTKMVGNLDDIYPGIEVSGIYSPPFGPISDEEDQNVINIINNSKPHFIWIGLGAPKQEIWMATHQGKVDGLMIGVGAGFDYIAGNIHRAPEWMQKRNLEWVYRLMQDPKRLLKRYLYTNAKYIWLTVRGK
ncbi:glycosyl transferase [Bacillus sp. SJS]|nr:glycosyl transferase [Bacillus sp. SJS]